MSDTIQVTAVERPRAMSSLIASAKRITSKEMNRANRKVAKVTAKTAWQEEAWDMYDLVGEQHFLATSLAGRLSKARLYVGTLSGIDSTDDPKPVEDQDINDVLNAIGGTQAGRSQLLERLAVNLFMVGEGWLVGIPKYLLDPENKPGASWRAEGEDGEESIPLTEFVWRMLSTTEVSPKSDAMVTLDLGDRKLETNPDDVYLIRVWRPHPRRWYEADSSTRATLPVLKELVGLNLHIAAQVDSRLAGAGLLLVPETAARALAAAANVPDQENPPDVFTEALLEAMLTPIQDRGSASALVPLVVTVPDETTTKFQFMTFAKPLDSEARVLREEAIRRIALGQDAPPEVLLGTSDMNHWGGWLVQEDVVSTHLAPPLALICDAITSQYLWPVLKGMGIEDFEKYVVWFDVSHLIVRPNKSADAQQAFDKGVISDTALRREVGFDESDAPETDDPVKAMILELIRANPGMLRSTALEDMITKLKAIMEGTPLDPAASDVSANEALPAPPTPAETAPAQPGTPAGAPATPSALPTPSTSAPAPVGG